MKTHKILLALLLCMVLGGATSAWAAAFADFAGFCILDHPTDTTAYCSFSALEDTAEANPSNCDPAEFGTFEWDLGDGNGFVPGNSYAGMSYPNAVSTGSVTVKVRVTCDDSPLNNDTATRHVVFTQIGCGRCINMNNGWD